MNRPLSPNQRLVLATIRELGTPYGTPLWQRVSEKTGREWAVGQVYVTLDRLEELGLIRCHYEEAPPCSGKSNRLRRHSTLTRDGEAYLEESHGL